MLAERVEACHRCSNTSLDIVELEGLYLTDTPSSYVRTYELGVSVKYKPPSSTKCRVVGLVAPTL